MIKSIRSTFLIVISSLCFVHSLNSQTSIDSLLQVYHDRNYDPQEEFNLLTAIAQSLNDPQEKLKYSQVLINRIKETDSVRYLFEALIQKGSAYRLKGDLSESLTTFLEAASFAQQIDSTRLIALAEITIADVYSVMGNHKNASLYYDKGINTLRQLDLESIDLASALLNAGDEYINEEKYEEALSSFFESSAIFQRQNHLEGTAYNIGNIGIVYALQGKPALAEANMNEAINILEEAQDLYAISIYLKYLADIYLDKNDFDKALVYAKKSLEYATKYELKEEISEANKELSTIYERLNDPAKSLYHFKEYISFRDSVSNINNVQELADLRTEYETSLIQKDADLKSQRQNLLSMVIAIILVSVSILAYSLFRRNQQKNRTEKILNEERQKSDALLRNILPEETALELRNKGHVKAKKFQSATILFTDFKGFTKYSEELPPEELVKTLDLYFTEFDHIVDKYKIEKIKTLGDSYMCASGLPLPDENHAKNMVLAAKEMLDHVEELKRKHGVDQARFEIKIGINSGPVVAGVVGERKFAYDIWGDAVNVAARLESTCEPGKINVSENTYQLVKDDFEFESRGEVAIKNRASVNMYYLK